MTSKGGWFRMFVDSATTEQGSTTNQPAVPSEAQSSSAFLRLMMVYSRRGLSLAAWLLLLVAFWLVVRSSSSSTASTTASSPPAASVTPREAADLRDEVKEMFYHGFDNYMDYAFPLDELRPMSCTGEDSLGGYALTLVDSLDMLALLGDRTRFSRGVNWLGKNLHFDKNKTVSVFETTIRVLGGLLSAHLIASDASTGMHVDHYDNELLRLAEDLGRRMLPAFDTPTGIPYGSVNLALGVSDDESQVSSTAGGGTLTLEFGVLSRLTGDPEFEKVTKRAVQGLWAQRSRLNLVGGHINVFTSEWTHKDAGIGTSIDSFYEYLLKAYLLLGDEEYLFIFKEAYKSVMRHLHNDPWYLEVNMNSGVVVWPLFNSLQAFWPGLQVLAGDVEPAIRTHKAFYAVWKRYGFTPEGFNLATSSVQPGQRSYPLRPELVESTYMLYKATRNPTYLDVGRDIVASLQKYAKCRCGYCHIADVESHEQDDHMESFFLSETVKYLWLLFDLAAGGDNLVEKGPHPYIFNTEGHFLPMSPEISLPSELCNESGSSCRERIVERLVDAKSQLMIEIEESRKAEEESSTGSCNVDSESGTQTCSITQHDGENRGTDGISPAESSQTGMCPKPNLWRQLGLNLAHQSPALTRAKPTKTPAKPLEGNLISVGRMAQAGSAFEKHARELLAQILKGSRSIVGDNGNALASFQVIRDAETGEITLRGDDEETGAVITLGGLDEAKSLLAGFNEEAGATVTLRGVDEAEPLRAGNNEEAGATVTLRGVDEAEPLRAGNNEEAGALVTLQGLDEEKPSSRAGDNEEVTVQEDNARDEGIQRQSAFVVEDTVHR